MKICFVHDYLNQFGGAERTLKAMHEVWPEAPVYTTLIDWEVVRRLGLPHELIFSPSWLHAPVVSKFYKYLTLFYPLVFESFDLSSYEVVISSSANFAKGVVTVPGQVHINYCHTPPRFLYHLPTETNKRQRGLWQYILMPMDFKLRMWDFTAAQRVDYFIANSRTVAQRISKFYRREAAVIYPPVELKVEAKRQKTGVGKDKDYYLVVSRLSAYKNVDLAISACALLGRPFKIVGVGPEEKRLEELARRLRAPVEFLGFVPDEQLSDLYGNCKALVFTVLYEDFGIVPVEAMSFGRPVIALRLGGVRETVKEGETGLFYEKPEVESLAGVIRQFESEDYFHSEECVRRCRQRALEFSKESFKERFKEFVTEKVASFFYSGPR